ncbi:hypothetical protein O6H91_03G010400 [Diphasiastrum complanatum]|uniref:Uncharacterized protein n=2 Tax=Diphasiastrum complanatum TaxID=34168 RepID=A0ACC2E3Q4_DIPCM|nr:hypothetical protein O6H91_03G009600 [Diphasiastrum complanatum]KAJ7561010.1 hypothetical protein O6H91_03G010400 [Diphasiastrum complanatum]
MAAVAQPVENVSDLLQKLKVDTHKNIGSKLQSPSQNGGSTENNGDVSGFPVALESGSINGTYEGPVEPIVYYMPNGYAAPHGYVYDYPHGGFESPVAGEWVEYPRYIGIDGVELHNAGFYGENGPLMYHPTGFATQPAYIPYSAEPMTTMGADGQFYGPPAFQYQPGPIYQQALSPSPQYFPSTVMVTGELAPTREALPDSSSDMISYGNMMTLGPRPTFPLAMMPPQNSYIRGVIPFGIPSPSPQDIRPSFDCSRPNFPAWPDTSKNGQLKPGNAGALHTLVSQPASGPALSSQNVRPTKPVQVYAPKAQSPRAPVRVSSPGLGPGSLGRGYPPLSRVVPNTNTAGRTGSFDVENSANGNGRVLIGMDRNRLQGRGMDTLSNGNGVTSDILNEQNRGPRTAKFRIQGSSPVVVRHPGVQNGTLHGNNDSNESFAREQYNRPDFVTTYNDAKFFVIKSYSEDDVHKSIKYQIWTSTPNGNKRLEAAYQEALSRAAGKKGGCPVFLFFSVNASGQFCGLAEMVGPVDFGKSVDYWQQDKWSGQFAVKWHIIKDIPNSQFRHIILENNENKPVTNSRDTQEVKFGKGMEMLNIFKNYPLKACILDDFLFYESRQKAMQEKRTGPQPQQQQVLDQIITEQQKANCTLIDVKAEQNEEPVPVNRSSNRGSINGSSATPDGTSARQSDSS